MSISSIDPEKEATYQVLLGSTFTDVPKQNFHALKYNFKPAAIDYVLPGNLSYSEENQGEVSLALPSTTDGESHIFKGALQEAKRNEFVLAFDPETNSFTLERLSSLSRLAATRTSRSSTFNNGLATTPIPQHDDPSRYDSKSIDDVPTISLDPTISAAEDNAISDAEEAYLPSLITPRLPSVSPMQSRGRRPEEQESSDDDSEIIEILDNRKNEPALDPDDDVSDQDLDDLANELESSLENRPDSSSSDADSDRPPPPKSTAPNFNNIPRSGGPISMSRFAGARRREEEESSSSDDDDD